MMDRYGVKPGLLELFPDGIFRAYSEAAGAGAAGAGAGAAGAGEDVDEDSVDAVSGLGSFLLELSSPVFLT